MIGKRFARLMGAVVTLSLVSLVAYAHDGELDLYGCHYDDQRRDYHCHKGVFKGGSFDSQIQMVRLLKLQFLNAGRPWPYAELVEEDITTEKAPK